MTRIITAENDRPDMPSPGEQFLARRVTEVLQQQYPGHPWACHVGSGVVTVRNMLLRGDFGYYIHLARIATEDDFLRKVRLAGGEILERFALSRSGLKEQEVMTMRRDFARRPIADGS